MKAYRKSVVGRRLSDVFSRFGRFWQELAHEPQLRWVRLLAQAAVCCYCKVNLILHQHVSVAAVQPSSGLTSSCGHQ